MVLEKPKSVVVKGIGNRVAILRHDIQNSTPGSAMRRSLEEALAALEAGKSVDLSPGDAFEFKESLYEIQRHRFKHE